MDIQEVVSRNKSGREELERLNVAYVYAAKKHFGQLRQSGEPYMSHPLSVAYILAEMNMDIDSVIAGMLHDVLEDTDTTAEEMEQLFGKNITFLVDGLTKIGKIEFKSKEEKQAESFRKMLISMSEDIRVILIKLADRLHNMRTIDSLRPDKRKRIAEETIEIYSPLAHRLGIAWIKWELEDLSFHVLEPASYNDIQDKVRLNRSERETYLEKVSGIVKDALGKEKIKAEVIGRPKHFYSIYSKMMKKQAAFDEIYDLLGLRILVNTASQCYAALGVIHNIFRPIPARFKDYIATPKANMYQSLHTTVMGPDGQMVEFQIRTKQMHRIAEEGIAAHWKYKEGKDFDPKEDARFVWLRQLLEQNDKNSEELVETLKEDVLPKQIYVFTPGGDVVELPEGSTPIDFAYSIHSEVGNRCMGAKVNGRIVHLKYRIQNGEKIEILTSASQEPRKDWLGFVKTSRAKSRIRTYLRKKDSEKAEQTAIESLEKEFKEHGSSYREITDNPANLKKILDRLNFRSIEELHINVGFGRISARKVAHIIFPGEDKEDEQHFQKSRASVAEPFRIDGVDNMMIKIARCCTPLPGDEVTGYISTGRGIIVHKRNCPNIKNIAFNENRLIPVTWGENSDYLTLVKLLAIVENKPGMLNAITTAVKDMGLNIAEYSAKSIGGGESEQRFSVEIGNKAELDTLINKLWQIKGLKYMKKL
jgi:GTP pyrophosphokinase